MRPRVISTHSLLDIAHNSSSYSLILIIRSLPRSAGSFPSNNIFPNFRKNTFEGW